MADDRITTFRAPRADCDAEFTEKRSRFIGSVRTVLSADEAAEIIKKFPEIYPKANHHCWAYRIGTGTALEHCSDAGEPSGTAGRPILGVIKRHELTNTLIVVTRYFGGIKLGVRGLIDAYKAAAELAVEQAGAVEMEFHNALLLRCGYDYSKTLDNGIRRGRRRASRSAALDARRDGSAARGDARALVPHAVRMGRNAASAREVAVKCIRCGFITNKPRAKLRRKELCL